MKPVCYMSAALWVLLAFDVHGAVKVKAPVKEVSVYTDRALVTRTANLPLFKGKKSFIIRDLSIQAQLESVQVAAGNSVSLISFVPQTYFKTSDDNLEENNIRKRVEKLRAELETSRRQVRLHEQVLGKVNEYQSYLRDALGRFAVSGEAPPSAWQQGLNFVQQQSDRRSELIIELQNQIQDLSDEFGDLKAQLNQIRTSDSAKAIAVEVFLESDGNAPGTVTVSYIVNQASWYPHYDLLHQGKKVQLKFYGMVSQQSGEPWQNAKITLATGRPDLGLSPPAISSFRIRPIERNNRQIVLQTDEEDLELDDITAETFAISSGVGDTTIKNQGLELDFKVKQRKTIEANSEPHQVLVNSWHLDVERDYMSYPAAKPYIFHRAQCKNGTGYPLLAGTANVYGKSGFLGKTRMPFTPVDAKLTFSLGVVQDMRISRSRKYKKRNASPLPGARKRLNYFFENRIWNFSNEARRVLLYENLPVSNIDDVKVFMGSETKPKPKVEETGKVTWEVDVPSGKMQLVEFDYVLTAPKNFTLPNP